MRTALKTIALAIVVSSVAACATLFGDDKEVPVPKTPEQIVFTTTVTYSTLLALVTQYESLPRCAEAVPQPCSDVDVVNKIRVADNATYSSLNTAQIIVRDEDGVFETVTKEKTADALKEVIKTYLNLAIEVGLLASESVSDIEIVEGE